MYAPYMNDFSILYLHRHKHGTPMFNSHTRHVTCVVCAILLVIASTLSKLSVVNYHSDTYAYVEIYMYFPQLFS